MELKVNEHWSLTDYPLGVLGIIGSIIAIRYICRVNLKKEED